MLAKAYTDRGRRYLRQMGFEAAVADLDRAIELPGAPAKLLAIALLSRGILNCMVGNPEAAIADCTRVVELPGIPRALRIKARVQRGYYRIWRVLHKDGKQTGPSRK
jgi:hypothetical protein